MNNKLTWQDIIKAFFGILISIGTIIIVIISVTSYIDRSIKTTIKNPEYLRRIASHVRPAIIFNSNGSIINDQGGWQYIEEIKVEPRESSHIPKKIIVTPKQILESAPILTAVDPAMFDTKTERGKNLNWVYNLEIKGSNFPMKSCRFRLEIIY